MTKSNILIIPLLTRSSLHAECREECKLMTIPYASGFECASLASGHQKKKKTTGKATLMGICAELSDAMPKGRPARPSNHGKMAVSIRHIFTPLPPPALPFVTVKRTADRQAAFTTDTWNSFQRRNVLHEAYATHSW